jgi:hypothetical protein
MNVKHFIHFSLNITFSPFEWKSDLKGYIIMTSKVRPGAEKQDNSNMCSNMAAMTAP